MADQSPLSQFNNGDTAPTVRSKLNGNAAQGTNHLLTLRRALNATETLTLYTDENLIVITPFSVRSGGHLVIQQGARLRVIT